MMSESEGYPKTEDLDFLPEMPEMHSEFAAPDAPEVEFRRCRRLVGKWRYNLEGNYSASGPRLSQKGAAVGKLTLGGRQVCICARTAMDEASYDAVLFFTYDTVINRYHLTMHDNAFRAPVIVEGDWDAESDSIFLRGKGNSAEIGGSCPFGVQLEFFDENTFKLSLHMPAEKGGDLEPFNHTIWKRIQDA